MEVAKPTDPAAFQFAKKIADGVQQHAIRAEDKGAIEQAIAKLSSGDSFTVGTLDRLDIREDLKPHFLFALLRARHGDALGPSVQSGAALGQSLATLGRDAAPTDLGTALSKFYDQVGPGAERGPQETGLSWPYFMGASVTDNGSLRVHDDSKYPPDCPSGKVNGFEGALVHGDAGWAVQLERTGSSYDGPKELPLDQMSRPALLKLHWKLDYLANRQSYPDPRAGAPLKDIEALIAQRNGEAGTPYFGGNVRVESRLNRGDKLDFRASGPDTPTIEGAFVENDGKWTLEIEHNAQPTPDGVKRSFTLDELPAHVLMSLQRQLAQTRAKSDLKFTNTKTLALEGPVNEAIAARHADVEAKLSEQLAGQTVQRAPRDDVWGLMTSLASRLGFGGPTPEKAEQAAREVIQKLDGFGEKLVALDGSKENRNALLDHLREIDGALKDVKPESVELLSPELRRVYQDQLGSFLLTWSAQENQSARTVTASSRDVAFAQRLLSDVSERVLANPDVLESAAQAAEEAKDPAFVNRLFDTRPTNNKGDAALIDAHRALNIATSHLKVLILSAGMEGKGRMSQFRLNLARGNEWREAAHSLNDAAAAVDKAQRSLSQDKTIAQANLNDLQSSLGRLRSTWTDFEKLGATTSDVYAGTLENVRFLHDVKPHTWDTALR